MEEAVEFKLSENERIIKVVYHHPEIIAPNLALCFLILLLNFFLMYFFFLQGLWGMIVFFVALALVGFYVFRLFFLYRTNKFILTNRRLVDFEQTGLFKKNITSLDYVKIDGVEVVVRGVLANIFKYGNLRLIIKNNGRPLELYKIAHPLAVQQIINDNLGKKNHKEDAVEPIVSRLEEKKTEEQGLDHLTRVLEDIEVLSVKEKEDLLRILEDDLRESSPKLN
jgi:uncharacterized membrane protein YdbT with pleckstrin-like domain